MRVVANKTGFYGQLRETGEEFEVPDNEPKSSWFSKVSARRRQGGTPEVDDQDGNLA